MREIINGLWVGNKLSALELLTLHSFIRHGYDFHLWVYDKIENQLPAGVTLCNANEIVQQEKIFFRKQKDPVTGVGKGSLGSPFSDIFRYKLLYEKGGWWADMDITCLKPIEVNTEYYFRAHDKLSVIGNIIKCPKGSELMKLTYEEVISNCDENTIDWLLPNKILNKNILLLKLDKFVYDNESNNDIWPETYQYIVTDIPVPRHFKFFHWMNEEWRVRNIDKNRIFSDTALGKILKEYNLPTHTPTQIEKLTNTLNQRAISFSFSYWQLIKLCIAAILFLYAAWEIYWYTKVGLACIKWHTHLMVFAYLFLAVYVPLKIIARNWFGKIASNCLMVFTSVISTFFIIELFLCTTNFLHTRQEKFTGHYNSLYYPSDKSHYHVWPPEQFHKLRTDEFNYGRMTNSLGYSDHEWAKEKKSNEFRILSLGDSFTEGDGAPYDSSYVSFLRKKVSRVNPDAAIMNAGACGSDPFYNFIDYKDRLSKYLPDIIIQTISSDDVKNDLAIRGGMERFCDNGKVKYNTPPWWEPIYAISFSSRILFEALGYNELLRKEKKEGDIILENKISELLKEYSRLAESRGSEFILVLLPLKNEVEKKQYGYDFNFILRKTDSLKNTRVVSLLPYYIQMSECKGKNIKEFYWKRDGHHNPKGYEMMADGIYEMIKTTIPKD